MRMFWWVAVALVVAVGAAPAQAQKRVRVLVMPLTPADPQLQPQAQAVTAVLLAQAQKAPGVEVKALRDVESILDVEQRKQMLGCAGAACAADLAGALEAEQVIQAQLARLDGTLMLSVVRLRSRDAVSLSRQVQRLPDGVGMDEVVRSVTTALMKDEVTPQVTLELRVMARLKGSKEVQTLQPGDRLAAGDEVAFEVKVSPSAHVYLIQKTKASGNLTVLFPQPDIQVVNPLGQDSVVRIPAGTDFFEVDNQDLGTESVYVVASPHEMPRLQEAVLALAQESGHKTTTEDAMLALLSDGKNCSRKNGLDAPGCASRTRGLKLKTSGKTAPTARLSSVPGDDALLYTFSFEHVAAPSPK